MDRIKSSLIPCLLTILAFLLCFSLISKGPYHSDCLGLAAAAEQSILTHKTHYMHGHGYPLTSLLGILFVGFFRMFQITDPVFAVNFMNVFFSALCIFFFYQFLQNYFNHKTAVIGTFLLGANPLFLSTSIYGNSHTPFLFFLFLSLIFLTKYLKAFRVFHLIIAAFCLGLAGAARAQDMAMLLIPLTFLYFFPPKNFSEHKKFSFRIKNYFLAILFVVIPLLFFFIPVFFSRGANFFDSSFFEYQLSGPFSGIFSPYLQTSFFYILQNFNPFGLIFILMGFLYLFLDDWRQGAFWGLWFIISFLFFGNFYTTTPRFLLTACIALIIMQIYFFDKMLSHKHPLIKTIVKLFYILIIVLSFHKIYPVLLFRHHNAISPDYAKWIAQVTEPDAQIIVGDEGTHIRYYAKRFIIRQIISDVSYFQQSTSEQMALYQKNLDKILNKNIPLYITESGLLSNNKGGFQDFLKNNYTITLIGEAPFEVWHRRCLEIYIRPIKLYRIQKK